MTKNISSLKVGEKAKVTGFEKGNKLYRQKLLSMGLTPGIEFTVTRLAPMGDPIEINIRGFSLSLRKDEAATVLIELL